MSDFNPLDRAKIAVHRPSFDLSCKKLFTAKVGEILPVYWQIAIPGNKYRIRSDWFTRTVPVNTAAYTRIKEYYDFYAVPLRLIARALPQAFTQMSDYMTSAASNAANTEQFCHTVHTSNHLQSMPPVQGEHNYPCLYLGGHYYYTPLTMFLQYFLTYKVENFRTFHKAPNHELVDQIR